MAQSTAEVDALDIPDLDSLPESPVAGVEPLLDLDQLEKWLKVSRWYFKHYGSREEDPFPLIGTARAKRALPSDVIAWMRRNKDAA